MNDTELLDALETCIKTRGYVFIHDLTGSDDPKWPQNYTGGGIGLMGWSKRPRSIRAALEAALKPREGK